MISVVMPCYNAERFLPQAIESILGQTFRALELVAVDDGSTDSTLAILQRYAAQDSRVRVIRNDHGGISSALNRGVQESRYDWIARMDGDDVALPKRLETQMAAALRNPRVVVWGAYAYHVNREGRTLGTSRTGPTSEAEFRATRAAGGEVHVIHPTAMLHRPTLLKEGGYDARFNGCEDFELFDRMAEHGPVIAIPEPLLLYRVHATSVSMRKFFTMRRLATYVIARHKARAAGQPPPPPLEQYLADEANKPLPAKVAWWMFHGSGFYYRSAGLAYGEGRRVRAGACFAAAAALNPRYAIRRVWSQFLSGKVRRLLGGRDESIAPTEPAPAG